MSDTVDGESIGATIRQCEDRRFAAMQAGDVATLEALLDDDVIYIHSSAVADDKATYLDSLRSARLQYEAFERRDTRVVVLGPDIALVSGRISINLVLRGERKQLTNLYIASWIMRDSGWRMASWQSTPIPAS